VAARWWSWRSGGGRGGVGGAGGYRGGQGGANDPRNTIVPGRISKPPALWRRGVIRSFSLLYWLGAMHSILIDTAFTRVVGPVARTGSYYRLLYNGLSWQPSC
jgi:hypothetical protein